MKYSEQLPLKTIEIWQSLYKEKLADKDAIEINNNITAIFNLLYKWERSNNNRQKVRVTNSFGHKSEFAFEDGERKRTSSDSCPNM